jgi:methyl-accepting chemotaxis protein
MFGTIRSKLILSVVIMAALLGGLIYVSSARLGEASSTMDGLNSLQEFKSHVMAPQKDMNNFIWATDNTILLCQLKQPEEAQKAFDTTVDNEQDISGEFDYLEKNGKNDLLAKAKDAHVKWEIAMEFMKIRDEKVAKASGITLVRASTAPTKTVDAHTDAGIAKAQQEYGTLSVAELNAIAEDRDKSPVEVSDNAIDDLEKSTTAILTADHKAADATLARTRETIVFGSAAVLVAVVLIGLIVAVSVSRPLSQLKEGAEQIADGNLDYVFTNVRDDEVGSVIHSVQKMAASLKERIDNLVEVAGIVMVTGDDITSAAGSIQPKGAEVEAILAKAGVLKELIGQALKSTKAA